MRIRKNLINFLEFRKEVLKIDDIASNDSLQLPPVYKSFITVFEPYLKYDRFDLGKGHEKVDLIFPKYFRGNGQQKFTISDKSICPLDFKEVEELLEIDESDMWEGWKGDLIFIANHSHYGGLMLGVKEYNADKIFYSDGNDAPKFVADHIFEFLNRIYFVLFTDQYPDLEVSDLYKRWGEDLWRVRGENFP